MSLERVILDPFMVHKPDDLVFKPFCEMCLVLLVPLFMCLGEKRKQKQLLFLRNLQ